MSWEGKLRREQGRNGGLRSLARIVRRGDPASAGGGGVDGGGIAAPSSEFPSPTSFGYAFSTLCEK